MAAIDDPARLPHRPRKSGAARLLAGPLGVVLARPWLDSVLLGALRHAYFPLSRAWAAADEADGDHEVFWQNLGSPRRLDQRSKLARALDAFERARVTARAVESAWRDAFFAGRPMPLARLAALEDARLDAGQAWMATRRGFVFTLAGPRACARLMIPTPAEFDAVAATAKEFEIPGNLPRITESHRFEAAHSQDSWLTFESPSGRLGDTVWARVHSPRGVKDPPTVIMGHGVCVEFDHWRGLVDETDALVRHGVRVIRPEAPWHGRRRPRGWFGGERMVGSFPIGAVDLFSGAVREWATLADWASQTSRGPLAFGGSSLGALTSQLAASLAHQWPERLRPRALYLITHSDQMADAMLGGPLATLWADPATVAQRGWTPELARRALLCLEPVREPVVDPAHIVSVQGERDVITPFTTGRALVERWNVPPENVFVSSRGHFTIPMSLMRDETPTRRFVEILKSL